MLRVRRARPVAALASGVASGVLCALISGCGAGGPDPTPPVVAPSPATATSPVPAPATRPTIERSAAHGRGLDRVEVDKCWTNATATTGGQLLVSARSSDPSAHLRAYRADGTLIGEVHNGGGQRYGGTVFAYERTNPGTVTIRSSAGGSITVSTTPFRPES
ncbi:hypothetical protein [Terrabacter sp. BE26]|uniref:hypothetical protein n=1 Tax=Terrabacter sp. BE26 TaxID=2898152 RepID=UPI0035BE94DA